MTLTVILAVLFLAAAGGCVYGWRRNRKMYRVIDRMLDEIKKLEGRFEWIRVGKPLLSSADDYKKAAHAVMAETEMASDEVLALIGQGTNHQASTA